jgi:hypothetical protein
MRVHAKAFTNEYQGFKILLALQKYFAIEAATSSYMPYSHAGAANDVKLIQN